MIRRECGATFAAASAAVPVPLSPGDARDVVCSPGRPESAPAQALAPATGRPVAVWGAARRGFPARAQPARRGSGCARPASRRPARRGDRRGPASRPWLALRVRRAARGAAAGRSGRWRVRRARGRSRTRAASGAGRTSCRRGRRAACRSRPAAPRRRARQWSAAPAAATRSSPRPRTWMRCRG